MEIFFIIVISLLEFCLASTWGNSPAMKDDLQNLNATCPSDKTCVDGGSFSHSYDCDCELSCVRQGTCCADSGYLHVPAPQIKPHCRPMSVDDFGILMIDRCPQNGQAKSVYQVLCREEDNDLLQLVPVTSLLTHITYKNYFCFRCYELNYDYVFWNVRLTYNGETDVQYDKPNVNVLYDENCKSWVAPVAKGGQYAPVTLDYKTPPNIFSVPKACKPSLITECSADWPNDDVRVKCNAYLQPTRIERENTTLTYKNPHCALCNFENLQDKRCEQQPSILEGAIVGEKRPFSFTFLLDINQSDGDKVGKIQRCTDGEVWDPFFEKCRTLKCALPGHVVQDGKCVKA